MKVLMVVASLNPEWGGPVKVVKHSVEQLVKNGVDVTIFSPISRNEKKSIVFPEGVDVRLFKRSLLSNFWTGFSFSFIKLLKQEIRNFDIVHVHELWHFPHFLASRLSIKYNIPFVITVHGALSSFALQLKSFKKKIFGNLFEKEFFRKASGIQAITKTEIAQIKQFEPGSKIKLIFNGIPENDVSVKEGENNLLDIYPEIINKRVALYLGRIDRIKGLDILVESFSIVSAEFDNFMLVIAGPDFGYKKALTRMIKERKIEDKVIFTGTLSG
ncbi:MAG: glycosyltransferase, partial [Candidatus Aminicenantes bacterium]|nr:glycosyltransferase [Candidatus Aminicenantes bacterium]